MVESSEGSGEVKRTGGDPIPSTKKKACQERKLCKGYVYFSSRLRSNGHGPSCIGSEKDVGSVPASLQEKYKIVSTREGKLSYFQYACVGYSVYLHDEDSSMKKQDTPAPLPICFGYELAMGKKSSPPSKASDGLHYKEALYFVRSRSTAHLSGKTFFVRFARSAELVASGVARNLLRAGSFVKDNLDDIFYPDRRRSK